MTSEPRITYTRQSTSEEVSFEPTNGTIHEVPQAWKDNGTLKEVFYVAPFIGRFERYTPNSAGSRSEWKSFQHYKRTAELSTSPLLIPHWTGHWNSFDDSTYDGAWGHLGYHQDKACGFHAFGGADDLSLGLPTLYVPGANDGTFIPSPVSLDSLLQSALKSLLPQMKVGLSLINSLIETKDFKSLPRTIRNTRAIYTQLKSSALPSAWGKVKDIVGNKRSRTNIRTVLADNYLQWSFNIKPLLSDVKGIFSSLRRLEHDVNRLIAGSAKLQRRHFTVPLAELSDLDDNPGLIGVTSLKGIGIGGVGYRYVRSEVSKFHAMIEYNYSYSQFQLRHAALLSLLDSYSVNIGLAKVVWNATKWTFLIDWVLGVSRYLDQYSLANMEPVINIRRSLWSISRKRILTGRLNLSGHPRASYPHATEHPVSVVHESAYRRQVWQLTRSSVELGGLNPKEFSLGVALLASRRWKRPRKR